MGCSEAQVESSTEGAPIIGLNGSLKAGPDFPVFEVAIGLGFGTDWNLALLFFNLGLLVFLLALTA